MAQGNEWVDYMIIEVGKPYYLTAARKKSVTEFMNFTRGSEKISVETIWRNGGWIITPQDQDEIDVLHEGLSGEEISLSFSEIEFDYCSDAFSEDWHFYNFEEGTDTNAIRDGFYDDGYMTLEEQGFKEKNPEVYITGGIALTPFGDREL